MANNRQILGGVLLAAVALFAATADAVLTKKSDTRNSKHNLSATATNQAYAPTRTPGWVATSETQICVFCHTPHGATAAVKPLWNKALSAAAYTGFSATSLDASVIQAGYNGQPGGSSKLCLSCHDGSLAVNNVNVINGLASQTVAMTNSTFNLAPGTYTAASGFTANIGSDLTNDHPISVDYTNALAVRDGELRVVSNDALQQWQSGGVDIIRKRGSGAKPVLPLEPTGASSTGQVQCSACHDAHIVDTDTAKGDQMFLRLNRFQDVASSATYTKDNDQICIACHDKNNGAVGAYAYSSHANNLVATQTYVAAAVTPRQFPAALPVWKASCLNCHQGHTAPGAAHLLSEGTTAGLVGGVPGAGGTRQGAGVKAQENTCYQCHTLAANSIITSAAPLIDIQTQMTTGSTSKHPTAAATEVHDIGGAGNKDGADGIETQANLGSGALTNRHAECTDCHNPHRVAKIRKIDGTLDVLSGAGYVAGGAHRHEDVAGYVHDNIASGVLRGTWGIEITAWTAPAGTGSANSFHALPSAFAVKRGDPGTPGAAPPATSTFVTREYQVCIKCHSNYAYTDDSSVTTGYDSATRPALGQTGLTVANSNGRSSFNYYTNQGKEFQAPAGHRGGSGAGDTPTILNSGNDGGAGMPQPAAGWCTSAGSSRCNANNHRSWHPVFGPTGRARFGGYLPPWTTGPGTMTMYCSDCHGSASTQTAGSVIPLNRSPTAAHVAGSTSWGPHGGTTTNNTQVFMLKGVWNQTANSTTANHLCYKCHCATNYGGTAVGTCTTRVGGVSGFNGGETHFSRAQHATNCQYCHVAIVHGWKNKSFLVNLNDVGPEAGFSVSTVIAPSTTGTARYAKGPYYGGAGLRITSTFGTSGAWVRGNCAQYSEASSSASHGSDIRLKRDIVHLETLGNGIKLYSFRYFGSDEVHVGVMAQDLLLQPAFKTAVTLGQDGYYVVNYQALGLRMISLAEWRQSRDNIYAGKDLPMRMAMACAGK